MNIIIIHVHVLRLEFCCRLTGEDTTFFAQLLANSDLTIEEAVLFSEELFIAGVESVRDVMLTFPVIVFTLRFGSSFP